MVRILRVLDFHDWMPAQRSRFKISNRLPSGTTPIGPQRSKNGKLGKRRKTASRVRRQQGSLLAKNRNNCFPLRNLPAPPGSADIDIRAVPRDALPAARIQILLTLPGQVGKRPPVLLGNKR